jgi:hypothetical protein
MGKIAVQTEGNNSVFVDSEMTKTGVAPLTAAVASVEEVAGMVHKTRITLSNVPVTVISVTTGNGVGGTTVYTLPKGRISYLGGRASLGLSIATAKQADFTDGTPEGDIGVGTLAPANADALGTDATDDDLMTAAAFVAAAFVAPAVEHPSEVAQHFNGSSTAKNVVVTVLVDAADIDDGVTTEVLISGTIEFYWVYLGAA